MMWVAGVLILGLFLAMFRQDPEESIISILGDSPELPSISQARKLNGGFEPTFSCVMSFNSDERANGYFDSLGLVGLREPASVQTTIDRISNVFPQQRDELQDRYKNRAWTGTLGERGIFVDAVLVRSNAYVRIAFF